MTYTITKAFLRRDLLERGEIPYLMHLNRHAIKWEEARFTCWQPDELDDQEFNLVMVDECSKRVFIGCSIDFDFEQVVL